jgi:hypothetical protein
MTWMFHQRHPDPWIQEVARIVSERVLERILFYVQPPPILNGQEIDECVPTTTPIPAAPPPSDEPMRFFLDALFLEESFHYLALSMLPRLGQAAKLHFKESFHYATGPYVPSERLGLVSHLVSVDFAKQSAGGVTVADDSNARALEFLDQRGLPLLLHVHTHPHPGIEATNPSDTDLDFQARLERGRHVCIGAIFDRRGQFIRFYATPGREFSVVIQGRGIQEVQPHVYRLAVANSHLPSQAPALAIERRGGE